jgi:outer membrane biosynthesis protein TonB
MRKKTIRIPTRPHANGKSSAAAVISPDVFVAMHNAAVEAVKQWKYSPTLLNSKAVPVRVTVTITFTYDKDGSPKIIAPSPP